MCDWFLFIFYISSLRFSLSSFTFFPSLVSIFITIILNDLSGRLLTSASFNSEDERDTGGVNMCECLMSAALVGLLDFWKACLGVVAGQEATYVMSGAGVYTPTLFLSILSMYTGNENDVALPIPVHTSNVQGGGWNINNSTHLAPVHIINVHGEHKWCWSPWSYPHLVISGWSQIMACTSVSCPREF